MKYRTHRDCRSKLIAVLAMLFVLLLARAAQAGGLAVYPIRVDLSSAEPASSVQLTNGDLDTELMHARVFTWDQQSGRDRLTPTHDIIVSPPIFSLHPTTTQVLRVGLVDQGPRAAAERAYRIVITEVPANLQAGKVRLTLTLSIPVFVAPPTATEAKLEIHARKLDRTHVQLTFSNTGSEHVRVNHLQLRDAKSSQVMVEDGSWFYVLAGASVARTIRVGKAWLGAGINVEAYTDRRAIQSSISLRQP